MAMSTHPASFTRRRILIAGAATVAAGTAALLLDRVFDSDSPLADSYAARRIGERFAHTLPDPGKLWLGTPPASEEQWAARLRSMIGDDFDNNRLIQVDGWWLAETELRLCVYIHRQSA